MSATSSPNHTTTAITAVARETLRRIATEQLSPTPENYTRVYGEIAAAHPEHPRQQQPGQDGRLGASVIGRLLTQLEVPHVGITPTRKREGLKRALVPRLEPLEALYSRLNRLIDSWNGPNAESGDQVGVFLGTDIVGTTTAVDTSAAHHLTATTQGIASLIDPARAQRAPLPANEVPERVVSFRLAAMLAQLLKNIDELTPDSALVSHQVEQIGRVLTAPLTEKKLDEAERCVRALIVRQGVIKHSIDETKRAIRDLAETLLARLSTLVSSTDGYATKVVDMAEQIASTNDLGKLADLTRALVTDARALSANVHAERALVVEAQERAKALEVRTAALEGELREASTLVRTDPLTRALNRRGFTEAYKNQLGKAKGGAPLSIALIDVDNFKLVNERFGHSVGDDVLCALVDVLQRASDETVTVSRYGGEEFALLFAGASAPQAELAVIKMQRALLDYLDNDAPQLPPITFSAGVSQVEVQETLPDVITRADRALRAAKAAGKNCVVIATPREAAAA